MASVQLPPGHFNMLYFATASSYTKKESEPLKAPLALSRLYEVLEDKYPGIMQRVLSSCAVTVNLEYVDVETEDGDDDNDDDNDLQHKLQLGEGKNLIIQPGDEVAIIPPVSSG